ncbi:MAG TPA: hypothetical protein PLM09_17155, partial [Casimicrobiaceae bacterium]|nr:hypothetical protein [Casimicrobiaceae bacterium]
TRQGAGSDSTFPAREPIWAADAIYVLVAIVKRELHLKPSLYTLLQILSVTLFEEMPLQQALADQSEISPAPEITIQLSIQGF